MNTELPILQTVTTGAAPASNAAIKNNATATEVTPEQTHTPNNIFQLLLSQLTQSNVNTPSGNTTSGEAQTTDLTSLTGDTPETINTAESPTDNALQNLLNHFGVDLKELPPEIKNIAQQALQLLQNPQQTGEFATQISSVLKSLGIQNAITPALLKDAAQAVGTQVSPQTNNIATLSTELLGPVDNKSIQTILSKLQVGLGGDKGIANITLDSQLTQGLDLKNSLQQLQGSDLFKAVMNDIPNGQSILTNTLAGQTTATGATSSISTFNSIFNQTQPTYNIATPIDNPAWMQSFSQKIHMLSAQNIQEAKIQLHPAELGHITARLNIQNNVAEITLLSQHAQVRELLESNLPQLRELFQQSQVNLGNVTVDQNSNQDSQQQLAQEGDGNNSESEQTDLSSEQVVQQILNKLIDLYA